MCNRYVMQGGSTIQHWTPTHVEALYAAHLRAHALPWGSAYNPTQGRSAHPSFPLSEQRGTPPPLCNSNALVRATVGVVSVNIWDSLLPPSA